MEKFLNYTSLAIKLLTVALGAATVGDATLLHMDPALMGKLVAGLGTAALVVKTLQVKTAA